jgi:hypothetical protein
MDLTFEKLLCGEELNNDRLIIESIERLSAFCWDIADRMRKGTANKDDAIRGIAYARQISLLLMYYDVREMVGLDSADLFLAREQANAAIDLSLQYVRTHND